MILNITATILTVLVLTSAFCKSPYDGVKFELIMMAVSVVIIWAIWS